MKTIHCSLILIATITYSCDNENERNTLGSGGTTLSSGGNNHTTGGSIGKGGNNIWNEENRDATIGNGGTIETGGTVGSGGTIGSGGTTRKGGNDTKDGGIAIGKGGNNTTDASANGGNRTTDGSINNGTSNSTLCPDGFPRLTTTVSLHLVSKFTPSPEGVTVCPGGDVFISIPGANGSGSEIKRIKAGETPEHYTTIENSQTDGITCDAKGRLFAAQYGGSPTPSTIIMVTGANDPGTRLPGPKDLNLINGIIAIPGFGVYASDTMGNMIIHTNDEKGSFETTVVVDNINQPNGLSYNPDNRTLYVGTSLNNTIEAFQINADGSLGTSKKVWSGSIASGMVDGTAVDENGTLYVANWLGGTVIQTPKTVLTDIIVNPASLAWRGGMLFVTDYKLTAEEEGGLYAIQLGICGPKMF
jgi:hypothetical protein